VQSVIGGATRSVEAAILACQQAGFTAVKIQVSHAFHTQIVAPASEPLRQVIQRMNVQLPQLMIAANVTGEIYPNTREEILDILKKIGMEYQEAFQTLFQPPPDTSLTEEPRSGFGEISIVCDEIP